MFSVGIEVEHWLKMGLIIHEIKNSEITPNFD